MGYDSAQSVRHGGRDRVEATPPRRMRFALGYWRRAAGAAIICALILGAWLSLRFARADWFFREKTPDGVARAVALSPRDTEYLSLRALQIDYDGGDPAPLLLRAAELNPLAAAPRMRLGLDAEIHGDIRAAEKWLLDAARVSRQFEPRWTLSNFYFRQSRADDFWTWIRQALAVSYGDRTPAFDLCWRFSQNPKAILDRAIPDRHDVLAAYLIYLIDQHHLDAAAPVSMRLVSGHIPADRELLLGAGDALLDARMTGAERELWQALGLPVADGITNPDFAPLALGHGFDWRPITSPGVRHTLLSTPSALRIDLSGAQPEACELVRQMMTVKPGARYAFHWKSRTQDLPAPSGLRWQIAGQSFPIEPSEDWRDDSGMFLARDALDSVVLIYQRVEGQPRAEGRIELRDIRITEARQ